MIGGHGSKFDRQQETAVAALLTAPTITEAAKLAGVGESTLRRWLAEPDFQAVYQEARQQALRMAVGRLHGLMAKATEALERAMTCGSTATEVRAAVAVFDQAFRGAELLDLEERVTALEQGSAVRGLG